MMAFQPQDELRSFRYVCMERKLKRVVILQMAKSLSSHKLMRLFPHPVFCSLSFQDSSVFRPK